MSFPCTSCGACCRRLWMMPSALLKEHGLEANELGHCVHLTADSLCSIYVTRPKICRVDELLSEAHITKADGYRATAFICNAWMDEDGSKHERVVIEPAP